MALIAHPHEAHCTKKITCPLPLTFVLVANSKLELSHFGHFVVAVINKNLLLIMGLPTYQFPLSVES